MISVLRRLAVPMVVLLCFLPRILKDVSQIKQADADAEMGAWADYTLQGFNEAKTHAKSTRFGLIWFPAPRPDGGPWRQDMYLKGYDNEGFR